MRYRQPLPDQTVVWGKGGGGAVCKNVTKWFPGRPHTNCPPVPSHPSPLQMLQMLPVEGDTEIHILANKAKHARTNSWVVTSLHYFKFSAENLKKPQANWIKTHSNWTVCSWQHDLLFISADTQTGSGIRIAYKDSAQMNTLIACHGS